MNPFTELLLTLILLYTYVVWADIILSLLIYFKIVNSYQPAVQKIGQVLQRLTYPVLSRIRKILPDMGGLDISPVILLLGLHFLRSAVIYYL